jgi:hypothetical protein
MALKCVTCGLLFRNRNELDWHVREEHLERRLPPANDRPAAPAATPGIGVPTPPVPEEKGTWVTQ